jgi:hypothetical protein
VEFNPYFSKYSEEVWLAKNTLAVLEAKSFKDLVYIQKGWTNQVITSVDDNEYFYETSVTTGDPINRTYQTTRVNNYGPQGVTDNWYTQTERYASTWADVLERSEQETTP